MPTVGQHYINVSESQKTEVLTRILEVEAVPGGAVLIFNRTKVGAAEVMHGDMN